MRKKVKAKMDFTVEDVEDNTLEPTEVKKDDIGVFHGTGEYTHGKACEISINDDDIFIYPLVFSRYFEVVSE